MSDQTSIPLLYDITLLRHGESLGNAEGKHQGQADFPLTERGKAQSQALADRWKMEGKRFDLIITSPLARAYETANIIASTLSLPLEPDPLLMERDNGLMAGLRPEEVLEILPQAGFIHPYQAIGQTGESQWELYLRAGKAVQKLLNRQPGSYLIVSHGGLLNMVFYAILGIAPLPNFSGPRFRFSNSAFATLSYNPNGHKWYVLGVNDHSHWKSDEN